jgi:hypothetical protein
MALASIDAKILFHQTELALARHAKEVAIAKQELKDARENLDLFNLQMASANAAVTNARLKLERLEQSAPTPAIEAEPATEATSGEDAPPPLDLAASPAEEVLSDEEAKRKKWREAKKKQNDEGKELFAWIKEQGHTPCTYATGKITLLRKQKEEILATIASAAAGAAAAATAFATSCATEAVTTLAEAEAEEVESVHTIDAFDDALITWLSPKGKAYLRVGHLDTDGDAVWNEGNWLWLQNADGSKGAYAGILLANGKLDASPAALADEPEF